MSQFLRVFLPTFGLNILIAFLDKHLAKDDLADSVEKFDDFDDFRREDGQSIHEYIAMFDAKYRKIEKKKNDIAVRNSCI